MTEVTATKAVNIQKTQETSTLLRETIFRNNKSKELLEWVKNKDTAANGRLETISQSSPYLDQKIEAAQILFNQNPTLDNLQQIKRLIEEKNSLLAKGLQEIKETSNGLKKYENELPNTENDIVANSPLENNFSWDD